MFQIMLVFSDKLIYVLLLKSCTEMQILKLK